MQIERILRHQDQKNQPNQPKHQGISWEVVRVSLQKTLILKRIKEQGARTVGEDTLATEEAVASMTRHPFQHPQLKTQTQHHRTHHIPTNRPRELAIKSQTVPKGAGATCSVS
jgi:hypothetical protein